MLTIARSVADNIQDSYALNMWYDLIDKLRENDKIVRLGIQTINFLLLQVYTQE